MLETAERAFHSDPMDQEEADRVAIIKAIAEECDAFYRRDFEAWASYWIHDESVRRMGAMAGGHVDYKVGWTHNKTQMAKIMRDHPKPNLEAGALVRRENVSIRVSGDMAWVAFDQYTPRTDDILINAGLSREIRVMERHESGWKVAFAGHSNSEIEYLTYPTIQVAPDGRVDWMNESARQALEDHPILSITSERITAKTPAMNRSFQSEINRVADLTPIDIRLSLNSDEGGHDAISFVAEDPFDDALHVIWIARIEDKVIVTFDDNASVTKRLQSAQQLYSLSDAQIRLAQLIVEGSDLPQAAETIGVSVNTVRTHLKRMFEKTKVASQTALVRVLLSANAPRD